MSNKRAETRTRTFLRGRIVFNNGNSTFDCVVRDLSPLGAKLVLTEAATLPDIFELHILNKEAKYRAQIRWRQADQIGVRFIDAEIHRESRPIGTESRIERLEAENTSLREEIERLRAELQKSHPSCCT